MIAAVHRTVGWFVVWALLGAAFALGTISFIGVLVLPAAALVTIVLARAGTATDGVAGIVTGLGLPLLYVAFLNRAGPDANHCRATHGGMSCVELMNPWPWLALGTVFVLAGVALFASQHGRRHAR
jgi:hypothetical protein